MRRLSSGHAQARLPITVDVLRSLCLSLEEGTSYVDGSTLWAAAYMSFFGFLQSGEVVVPSQSAYDSAVHLSVGDVRLENITDPKYVQVQIKSSKTGPFRHCVVIFWVDVTQIFVLWLQLHHIWYYVGRHPGLSFNLGMAGI